MNIFQCITKHRTFLMGIAMLLVFVFHSSGEKWLPSVLDKIVSSWFIGVDIFIFLSAIGLSYSMSKNPNVLSFFKRRLIRIFPAYCLIMSCVYLCVFIVVKLGLVPENLYRIPRNLWEIIQAYSTLGFWLPNGVFYLWYIPAILVLYLFFPLLHKAFSYSKLFYILVVVPSLLITIWHIHLEGLRQCFLLRIGIFVYGGIFAKEFLMNDKRINSIMVYAVGFLSLAFYLIRLVAYTPRVFNRFIEEMLFFIAIPCILVCLTSFSKFKVIDIAVSNVGKLSLEFYLIHEFMFLVVGAFSKKFCHMCPSVKVFVVFFLSLLASYIVHGIIKKLLEILKFSKQSV